MTTERAHRLQTAAWIGAGLSLLALLYLISPVLTPFLLALILSYIGNPLVERLVRWRLPRTVAAALTVLALLGVAALLGLILVPLVRQEAIQVVTRLPDLTAAANGQILPWLREHLGIELQVDGGSVRQFASEHLSNSGDMAGKLLRSLGTGGLALVNLLANLVLTPLLVFYLLQSWPKLLARFDAAIPRPWHGASRRILGEVDSVLSQFLRGQLMVMLLLALYYSLALWLAGVGAAVPVGLLTGFLIFIPYVGYGVGLILALLVAVLQFQGWEPVLAVAAVYGLGQVLEGFLLTPYLVGERIGLHPMAVIFALLAFSQLFGFAGVLMALPASAALLVALRELRVLYLKSHFYLGPEGKL
ncbi:MAG: AI-2E family transporter [Rhodocyclaceae bacterium]|nr:AI-2E family transporter [Rhodocyclaceae bacterium]